MRGRSSIVMSLILILIFWRPRKTSSDPKGGCRVPRVGKCTGRDPGRGSVPVIRVPNISAPPTKRLFLVSPRREEWPFTPFSLSRHSLILLHLVSRRGHMSSPDRETRVLGNKQKTGMFSTFCLHLLFIWGVLGLTQLTRFISRGIICGSAQQALPSVHHQLSHSLSSATRFPGFPLFIIKGRDCPFIIGHGQPWQTKNRPGPFLGPIYLNPVDGVRYASGVAMKVSYECLDERDLMVNKNSKCYPGKVWLENTA